MTDIGYNSEIVTQNDTRAHINSRRLKYVAEGIIIIDLDYVYHNLRPKNFKCHEEVSIILATKFI